MSPLSYESESVGNGFYLGNSPLKKGTLSYKQIDPLLCFIYIRQMSIEELFDNVCEHISLSLLMIIATTVWHLKPRIRQYYLLVQIISTG